jgi:hypothetical protein
MSSLTLSAYQFVTDWSIWAAALIALAVYVHVHKAALRILPNFDINFEPLHTYLDRLAVNLDWLRRGAPSEAVVVEPVGPVVEFAEPPVTLADVMQRRRLVAMLFASVERLCETLKLRQGLFCAFLPIQGYRRFQTRIELIGSGGHLAGEKRTHCQDEREARTAS